MSRMVILLQSAALAGLLPTIASAQGSDTQTYVILDEANYQEGCFLNCACPIFYVEDFAGSFSLTVLEELDGQTTYAVEELAWTISAIDLQVTGSGTYTIFDPGSPEAAQFLTLDLIINGAEPRTFDSAVSPAGNFPQISISINEHDLACYDQVFNIEASPAPTGDINLDGAVDSADLAVLLGHWGPCACPADLDLDQQVGAADLAMLLGNWSAD